VIDQRSDQIKALLRKHTPEVVNTAETLSANVRYVGVSSLGCVPEVIPQNPWEVGANVSAAPLMGIRPASIAPKNVVLPFICGLNATMPGLIPSRKKGN
jgi:hypothetical protein